MAQRSADERFWDRMARWYSRQRISDTQGYERTIERTLEHLRPGDRVLEFGCGTGSTALRLAPFVQHIRAIDVSGRMIDIARAKAETQGCANVDFARATLDSTDADAGTLDVVAGFNVLHLLRDLPSALGTIRRLLRPGGLFISKTPCIGDGSLLIRMVVPPMQLVGLAPHVNAVTAVSLRDAIEASGFEVLADERHGTKGRDLRPFLVARAS